ncbi:MAG: hypothetical protein C0501_29690 [Isosphaera sp.]|nr:hypothetical protein [Isosphaera sp.]
MPHPALTRRRFLGLAAVAPLAGCQGGFPTVFGYRLGADPLYDPNIKTVYVPVFRNRAFQTTPYRGFEVDITAAVVAEIGRTTPFRVTSDPDKSDTELLGVLAQVSKTVMNVNQQNLVREGEVVAAVDVVWRDLRDGTILSAPVRGRPGGGPDPVDLPFDLTVPGPPPPGIDLTVVPTRVLAGGRYLPELGETNASALNMVQRKLAVQIVSLMERSWG